MGRNTARGDVSASSVQIPPTGKASPPWRFQHIPSVLLCGSPAVATIAVTPGAEADPLGTGTESMFAVMMSA